MLYHVFYQYVASCHGGLHKKEKFVTIPSSMSPLSLSLSRVSSDDTTQSRQAINLESYSYIMSLSYVHKLIFYSLYCL